jgi:NADPH2:quinone reductase
VRAAQIAELGATPRIVEIEGDGEVEVLAVALNPLDLAVAAGRFYGGHPDPPYIPGAEAVGRMDGRRVYMFGEGYGVRRDGFLVERTDFPASAAVSVPEGIDDALAVATGIVGVAAWVPVVWRAAVEPSDRVLVLGATGCVGATAVQLARLRGAERVVAAGRTRDELERTRELGADETVALDGGPDLVERFRAACGGEGPTVVIDPLWAEPAAAAVDAAAPGARIIQLGQSAGPEATLKSGSVRGKQLRILGHANVAMAADERARAYGEVIEQVAAGAIRIDLEEFPLDDVAAAWSAQAAGRKAVVRL